MVIRTESNNKGKEGINNEHPEFSKANMIKKDIKIRKLVTQNDNIYTWCKGMDHSMVNKYGVSLEVID